MAPSRSVLVESARIVAPLAMLAAGVGAFLVLGRREPPPARAAEDGRAPLVTTVAAERQEGGLDLEVDGLAVPFREVGLAAEVKGRVVFKAPECRAGRYVRRGTLLFRIDPQDYQLEVERLTRELDQAGANLKELDVEVDSTEALLGLADEQLDLQAKELGRLKLLSTSRVASDTQLDEARRNELAARNSRLTLRNQLQVLKTRRGRLEFARDLAAARLKQARLDLARTEVHAPLDGVIVSEAVEENGYVQPGTTLVTLDDTSAVEVRCSLRMEELRWVWQQAPDGSASPRDDYQLPPTPVTVRYRLAGRDYSWKGTLTRYDGIGLDEKTRTVPCRVLVEKPRDVQVRGGDAAAGPRALVRGMYVTVHIHASPRTALVRLPERAVRPGNVAWRVRDGKLDIVPVQVALIQDGLVLVEARDDGLRAGDRVVVSPLAVAHQGMAVREGADG